MTKDGKLDRFDPYVPSTPWVNPWQADGAYEADLDLLEQLLAVAVGTSQQSGVVAGAADVWAAEELRRAGFDDDDEVWPRRTPPRVLPRDLRNFVDSALTKPLRAEVLDRFDKPGARRALPAEARVMGRAYTKQSDVLIASWAAGVEVLISTKTMLSSYQKNLRNRFEEGYGDAKNIRGRHPLASLGFLFVAGSDIPPDSLDFTIDMLQKLTGERDVYDCACLLVIDGAQGAREQERSDDDRAAEDESPALRTLPSGEVEAELGDDDDDHPLRPDSLVGVRRDLVPEDLGPNQFFKTLIEAALERMPVKAYERARHRRAGAPKR